MTESEGMRPEDIQPDENQPEENQPTGVDAAATPEGGWQPAPVIRYVTVQAPVPEAARAEGDASNPIIPRDLQPPEPRRP